jgi:hypothetical protein
MALLEPKRFIEVGDPVILYSGRGNLQLIRIEPGKTTNGKHGNYPHDALIGLEFGSKVLEHCGTTLPFKVTSKHGAGFVHALYPSPELWSQALDHRTEILYSTDIRFFFFSFFVLLFLFSLVKIFSLKYIHFPTRQNQLLYLGFLHPDPPSASSPCTSSLNQEW